MNMAPLFSLLLTFFLIRMTSMNAQVEASKEFKVGDADGPRQPGDNEPALYNQWTAKNRFHVGDSLRFQYTNDSVLVVEKFGYFHCNMTHPISTFHKFVIDLDKPGPAYLHKRRPRPLQERPATGHRGDGPALDPSLSPLHCRSTLVIYGSFSISSREFRGIGPVTMVSGLLTLLVTFVTP